MCIFANLFFQLNHSTFIHYLRQQQSEALWFGLIVTRLAGKTLNWKITCISEPDCRIQKPVEEQNLGGTNFGEEATKRAAAVELNI